MKGRAWVLIGGSISFLIFVIFLVMLLADRLQMTDCGCPKAISHNFIFFFIVLAVLFVSSLLYYLFSTRISMKEQAIQKNIEVIYAILDQDEKEVITNLVQAGGVVNQSTISKRYGKIKAHRIVKKLQDKKIIDIEKKGRNNAIKLQEELRRELI